jgi:hypothetical protein
MIKIWTKLTNYEPNKIEFKLNADITDRKSEVNCPVNGYQRDPVTIVPYETGPDKYPVPSK